LCQRGAATIQSLTQSRHHIPDIDHQDIAVSGGGARVVHAVRRQIWAFVRHWYENGECSPQKLLPSFESWTQIVGGIVEAAQFASPCQQTSLKTGGDTVTQDMEKLIAEMNPDSEYRFSDLVDLARDHQLFARLIPEEGDMEKDKSTRLSLLILKFIDRIFTVHEKLDTGEMETHHFRFCLSGETPKTRRFFIRKQDCE
jgi:hypothetical protein